MMRENQVHSSAVNVEVLTQIFASHSGTFGMPAGETVAPRRGPAHDMFRLRLFPEGEIGGITLFTLSVKVAGGVQYIIQIASGKFSVVMILVIFGYIEIDGAFTFVSISGVQNLLYQLDLFDDMARSMRFDTWREHVEGFHCFMVAVQIVLNDFHWFQFFQTGFLGNFVFSFVGIMFQMTYVSDIAYITYFIS